MPDTATTIEVITRRYIDTEPKLRDFVFNKDPLMDMLDSECLTEVGAGSSWNFDMMYDVQDGGAYSKGQDLPADQRQIEQQLRFDQRYQVVMIPFYKEDIRVINVPGNMETVVDLVTERVDAAYMQLGAQTAISMYLQGQTGYGVKLMNGLMEAYNSGSGGTGLDNTDYPVYGQLTRATYGGRMLAPAPVNINGGISLQLMNQLYQSVVYGSGDYEPNVIMTTVVGFGYIRDQYQTMQRFVNVTKGNGGFRGMEYNGATIFQSRYVPGSYLTSNSGTNDKPAQRFFAYSTGGGTNRYPALAGLSTGESIWFLNVRKPHMKYYVSKNAPFNGSLDDDGFIPSAGNTKIVGKVLLAHNLGVSPGMGCYAYNFSS